MAELSKHNLPIHQLSASAASAGDSGDSGGRAAGIYLQIFNETTTTLLDTETRRDEGRRDCSECSDRTWNKECKKEHLKISIAISTMYALYLLLMYRINRLDRFNLYFIDQQ